MTDGGISNALDACWFTFNAFPGNGGSGAFTTTPWRDSSHVSRLFLDGHFATFPIHLDV